MIPHEIPGHPWSKIGTDLFEIGPENYLIIIDYYSKFPEVIRIPNKTAHAVISATKSVFAREGIPDTVVSDNGPCYDNQQYRDFACEWEFHHVKISAGYSQSNGQVESAVKTVKRLMKKAYKTGQDPYISLLEFRNTPFDGTDGFSPSQLLKSRILKSKLPTADNLIKPHIVPSMLSQLKARQMRQKYYYDRTASHKITQPKPGQAVRFRNAKNKWEYGIVKETLPQPRCVLVNTPSGKVYKRNRRHMYPTRELPPPPELLIDDGELTEPVCETPSDHHDNLIQPKLSTSTHVRGSPSKTASFAKYEQVKIRQDITTGSGRVSKGKTQLNL